MAKIEHEMGIKSTYYFRKKPFTFKPEIIRKIAAMGHEIGYHYENLSDTDGDTAKGLDDFKKLLGEFRQLVAVQTCSMHGRPFKSADNRDLWRIPENHRVLKEELGMLGEVYLDIDYSNIAYINDTGRNWTSGKSNRRDKVASDITADFSNGDALLAYLEKNPHPRICFQIHPERWTENQIAWCFYYLFDSGVNLIKTFIALINRKGAVQ